MNAYQKQCIEEAQAITATGPLPDTVKVYTDTCRECARLYWALVNGGNKDAYIAHRKSCPRPMGVKREL